MPYRKGCPYAVETFGRQEWRSPKSYSKMVNEIYMCEKIHQVWVIFLHSDAIPADLNSLLQSRTSGWQSKRISY